MKVAVTGAAGFIGSNLVLALLELGDDVVAVDRTIDEHLHHERLTWRLGDVLSPPLLVDAFTGAEMVFHLAAMISLEQRNDLVWLVNTQGPLNAAEAALSCGVRRFVHCSSIHSFDLYRPIERLDERSERAIDEKIPVYDRSKYAGEQNLHRVIDRGLDAVICNPTAVFGPRDYRPLSRINDLLWRAARGWVPAVVTGGFDFIDVRDVVAGLIAAGERGENGENYLLAGESRSILDALRASARVVGRRGPAFALPVRAARGVMPLLEPLGRRLKVEALTVAAMDALSSMPDVDGSKAKTDLGLRPRPFADTVRDLIDFLIESGQF